MNIQVRRCLRQVTLIAALAAIQQVAAVAAQSTAPAGAAPPSDATQADASGGLVEIIVTAQRRAETVQTTPLAVTAFNFANLQANDQTSIADLAENVPNLNVSQVSGRARLTIRGIGLDTVAPGQEGSVAMNVDGVYYSRTAAAMWGFYDLDRIEVLRGPQGTLYGRNATGGSVNLLTKQPGGTLDGYLEETTGNYGTANFEGAVGGPVSDTVSGRLSFQTEHHDGYGKNLVTGHDIDNKDSQAVRGQLLFKPIDRLSILLSGDYYRENDNASAYHYFGAGSESAPGVPIVPIGLRLPGGFVPSNILDIASSVNPTNEAEGRGGLMDIDYVLSDTVSVRSLSAIRNSDIHLEYDNVPTGPNLLALINQYENSTQYSQEFQLNIDTDSNKFVSGLYYFHEKLFGLAAANLNAELIGGRDQLREGTYYGGDLWTDAVAGYFQDTYSITPRLRVTAGGRYSWERKSVDDQNCLDLKDAYVPGVVPSCPHRVDHVDFDAFTPKVGIDFDVAQDVLLYASWSKGFKSGNYSLGTFSPPVQPEKVTAYEVGIKSTLFDRRFRADVASFYYDYTDLQVSKSVGTTLVLLNAATATDYGIEGEFTAEPLPDRNFVVTLNTSWLHARFSNFVTADPNRPGQGNALIHGVPNFDLEGNELVQAPNYTINLGAQYTYETGIGSFTVRGESTWVARTYFTVYNLDNYSQAPVNTLNAAINYQPVDKHFYANAYVKNISDKQIIVSGAAASTIVGGAFIGYVAPPRTYGLTAGVRF